MILFQNVFITDDALTLYDRGLLGPPSNRLDVFKYSLASLAEIDFEDVVVYCELDHNYKSRQSELEAYIASLFKNYKFYPYRNLKQSDWQKCLGEISKIKYDGLIWFSCNDDHIFVDYETALVDKIKVKLHELRKSEAYVSSMITHWGEVVPYVDPNYISIDEDRPFRSAPLEVTSDYFIKRWSFSASYQIVNYELLHYWWFKSDYGDTRMPRTDNSARCVESPDSIACIIPLRELVRHFDGSSHMKYSINACPPLSIPPGFFENDIKIGYCLEDRRPGYVHVNPFLENYATVDPQGADLRCTLDELPVSWKKRISHIEQGANIDLDKLRRARNCAFLKMACYWMKLPYAEQINLFRANLKSLLSDPSSQSLLSENPKPPVENYDDLGYPSIHKANFRNQNPDLSFIILSEPGTDYDKQTMASILGQEIAREKYEVIYVRIAPTFERELMQQADTIITSRQPVYQNLKSYHKGIALNAALMTARGKLVTVCDYSTHFPVNFASEVLEKYQLVFSNLPQGLILRHRCAPEWLDKLCEYHTMSFRRGDLLAVGGFNECPKALGAYPVFKDVVIRLQFAFANLRLEDQGLVTKFEDRLQRLMSMREVLDTNDPENWRKSSLLSGENSELFALAKQNLLKTANKQIFDGNMQKGLDILLSELSSQEMREIASGLVGLKHFGFEPVYLSSSKMRDNPEALNLLAFLLLSNGLILESENHVNSALKCDQANCNSHLLNLAIASKKPDPQIMKLKLLDFLKYYPGQDQAWAALLA